MSQRRKHKRAEMMNGGHNWRGQNVQAKRCMLQVWALWLRVIKVMPAGGGVGGVNLAENIRRLRGPEYLVWDSHRSGGFGRSMQPHLRSEE
jgi:hypothetical protein